MQELIRFLYAMFGISIVIGLFCIFVTILFWGL